MRGREVTDQKNMSHPERCAFRGVKICMFASFPQGATYDAQKTVFGLLSLVCHHNFIRTLLSCREMHPVLTLIQHSSP